MACMKEFISCASFICEARSGCQFALAPPGVTTAMSHNQQPPVAPSSIGQPMDVGAAAPAQQTALGEGPEHPESGFFPASAVRRRPTNDEIIMSWFSGDRGDDQDPVELAMQGKVHSACANVHCQHEARAECCKRRREGARGGGPCHPSQQGRRQADRKTHEAVWLRRIDLCRGQSSDALHSWQQVSEWDRQWFMVRPYENETDNEFVRRVNLDKLNEIPRIPERSPELADRNDGLAWKWRVDQWKESMTNYDFDGWLLMGRPGIHEPFQVRVATNAQVCHAWIGCIPREQPSWAERPTSGESIQSRGTRQEDIPQSTHHPRPVR